MKIISLEDVGIKIPKKKKVTVSPEVAPAKQSEAEQPTQTEESNSENL